MLIGRYLPIKLLGKGGFGAAFLARDRYTPAMRKCVVKQFQPSGDLNPQQLQIAQGLFEREGQVLEELGHKHPQIPDLLAFFELAVPGHVPNKPDPFFYLVQEFIDGEDMEQELARRGAFSEAEVREVLVEILKVLKFVHENGSIHRDIKPSNIMRDRSGRLYLLDFGAVKQVTAAAASGPAANSSTGIYSMGFAPPEQMAGNVVYPATDLYALGVTCITLLTGRQPGDLYDSYSNSWNWRAYVQASDLLEAVLNRLLLPTPSQRFQSAEEVLQAIAQKPPAPPPPAPSPPVSSPSVNPPLAAPPAASSTSLQAKQAAKRAATPPAPAQAQVPAQVQPSPPLATRPSFSTLELLGGAAFTGFEGGLLAIALVSVLNGSVLGAAVWLGLVGGLVVSQAVRMIEKVDLLIIAAVTLGIILFFPFLRDLTLIQSFANPLIAVVVLAVLAGLIVTAIATLFRLVYTILSNLF